MPPTLNFVYVVGMFTTPRLSYKQYLFLQVKLLVHVHVIRM